MGTKKDSGGLALLWREKGTFSVINSQKYFIDVEVHIAGIPDFQYTGFYGCPETNRRRHSWEILKSLKNKSLLLWCIAGDFNDILSYGDKMGKIQQPTWRLDGFRRARLDRALATTAWRVLFNRATVYHMETACSDHMALFISLGISIILYSPVKFHFENSWLRETDVKEAVEEGWNPGKGQHIAS
ncbi:hypothetical protein KY284_010442 [Solanum tuberosum]|nr:hypothetical protein KY284_010442 [Solanum tuberosum]